MVKLKLLKVRLKSAHNDFKTGIICKISFILGIILFLIYLIDKITSIFNFDDNLLGIIIAFVILFFGVGLLLFFISCQFSKLSKIADEIENTE